MVMAMLMLMVDTIEVMSRNNKKKKFYFLFCFHVYDSLLSGQTRKKRDEQWWRWSRAQVMVRTIPKERENEWRFQATLDVAEVESAVLFAWPDLLCVEDAVSLVDGALDWSDQNFST